MKKLLTLFLALITVLSVTLVACNDSTPPSTSDDDGGNEFVSRNPTTSDTSDTDKDDDKNNTGAWENLDGKTVYVMANSVNIRDGASKSDKSLATVNIGDSFPALATNDSWYKITYNNEEAYISADFVTTDTTVATFNDFQEADYVVLTVDTHGSSQNPYTVNLRTMPALDEIGITVSLEGDSVKRIYATNAGQLVKIGQNQAGTIWKVKYTPTGSQNSTTYYIGKAAFVNFDGKVNDSSTTGGASRG